MIKRIAFIAGLFFAALLWAASEEVRPNAAYTADAGSWSGAYTDIDEDDTSLDGAYVCCADGDSCDSVAFRQPFATPSGDPTTGSNEQTIRISVTKTRNNCVAQSTQPDPTYELFVYENGTQRVDLTGGSPVSVTGPTQTNYTWTYSGFSSSDGSGVEVKFVMSDNGSGGSGNRLVSVDAMEWQVSYTAGGSRRIIVVE